MSTKNGCNVYFLAHPVIWDSEKVEREKNHLILYIKWIVVHFVLFFLLIILCSMKGSNTKEKSILFFYQKLALLSHIQLPFGPNSLKV